MNVKIVSQVEAKSLKNEIPELRVGDTVKLGFKVIDRKDVRIQNFEGIIIRLSGSGMRKSMTVRKIGANGVGVERIVPVNSPAIDSIVVLNHGKVRRARLYYLRDRVGKAATNLSR